MRRWLAEKQEGVTALEYAVLAAFIVLFIVGAAVVAGPKIKGWMNETISDIVSGK